MVKTYQFNEETIKKIVDASRNTRITYALLLMGGFSVYSGIKSGNLFINMFSTPIPFVIVITYGLYIFGTHNRQKEILSTQEYHLEEDKFTVTRSNITLITLTKDQVASIYENHRGLRLLTDDWTHGLNVTNHLDSADYEEIKQILSTWSEIRAKPNKAQLKILILINGIKLTPYLGLISLFSSTIWIVITTSGLVISLLEYSYFRLRKSKGNTGKNQLKSFRLFSISIFIVTSIKLIFLTK